MMEESAADTATSIARKPPITGGISGKLVLSTTSRNRVAQMARSGQVQKEAIPRPVRCMRIIARSMERLQISTITT